MSNACLLEYNVHSGQVDLTQQVSNILTGYRYVISARQSRALVY